ncbi:MAG: hypothetical protein P4L99_09835 [Chthoniobacter sp.]|nr:hypothetical protein [Chthoniobacter sp.]
MMEERKTVQRSELRIARGTVVGQLDSGLVLNCSGWVVKSLLNPGVYAGDGPGMNVLYANLVETHEQSQFGRLMAVDHGVPRQSLYSRDMWSTNSYLSGLVLVKGYPPASAPLGKGIKVVVAPSSNATWQGNSIPGYTADFTLTD